MVKSKRPIDDVDTYESDGGFVSNDDGKVASSDKKSKKAKTTSQGKGADGNAFWSLSSGRQPRRVEVSEFKGTKLISIREFYEKDDEYLPGKKGISLSIDQYKALLKAIPAINLQLKDAGVDVLGNAVDDDDEETEAKAKTEKKAKKVKAKANIEATSDEEEDED